MTGTVETSNFSGRFRTLNGIATLSATRADIIRSLLTVGYPSRKAAIGTVGPWRSRMLVAMASGYLDRSLNTTQYFRNLEQTEKVGVSFLFGEAFTHWYSQDRMNIEYLVHVAGLKSCVWGAPSSPLLLKKGATMPAAKSRPDFIGLRRREWHVFESKGRIRKPSSTTVGKALGQVSMLRSVNGKRPATRSASFFMLKASGTEGKVIDPPASPDGLSVSFDKGEAIDQAYRFFLDGPVKNLSDDIGQGYVGREIETGVFFGVDKQVLSALSNRPTSSTARARRVAELFDILASKEQSFRSRQGPLVSAGLDGTLLLDRREPHVLRRAPFRPRIKG